MVGVSADSNQARQAGMLDATSPQLRTEVDKREVLRIGREGGKHGVWCVCFINKWSKGLPTAKSATCLSRSRAKARARVPSSNTSISNCCSFPKRTPSSSQSPTSATLSNKSKPRVGPSSSKRIQCESIALFAPTASRKSQPVSMPKSWPPKSKTSSFPSVCNN